MDKNTILYILFLLLVLVIVFIYITQCTFGKNGIIRGGKNGIIRGGKNGIIRGGTPHKDENNPFSHKFKLSYTIQGETNGLDFSVLRDILKQKGFYECSVKEQVHYSYGGLGSGIVTENNSPWDISPYILQQRVAISNLLYCNNITHKNELYKTVKQIHPSGMKFIPRTYSIKEFESLFTSIRDFIPSTSKKLTKKSLFTSIQDNVSPTPKSEDHESGVKGVRPLGVKGAQFDESQTRPLFILKKKRTGYQEGVRIINSRESYYKYKKELNITHNGIVSEYITNPLTVDGKKFHLRVYFLLSIMSGIIRCISYDEYNILTAKEKYKQSDWLNTEIHISGGSTTDKNYYFPADIDWIDENNKTKTIISLEECKKAICLILVKSDPIKHNKQSNGEYQLLGADILLSDNNKAYILEINRRPGFQLYMAGRPWESHNKKFSHNLFSFILSNTVFPYFGLGRQPIVEYSIIGSGPLSPFKNVLIGHNRCTLVPYATATEDEKRDAEKLQFLLSDDAFLICMGKSNIIGCLGVNSHKYISISHPPPETHIGTAMVALLLDIYSNRSFAKHKCSNEDDNLSKIVTFSQYEKIKVTPVKYPKFGQELVYIKGEDKYLSLIATKLHFKLNTEGNYERTIKLY